MLETEKAVFTITLIQSLELAKEGLNAFFVITDFDMKKHLVCLDHGKV